MTTRCSSRPGRESIKGKSLRRDGRVSLCVDEDAAALLLRPRRRQRATISEDPSSCAPGRRRIGGRYMGAERAEQFGERNGVPGELLVRITPTKIVAQADIAD